MIYGDLIFEKDENLTRLAKNIFGEDLVLNAYVSTYHSEIDPAYQAQNIVNEHLSFVGDAYDDIDIGAREIGIEFASGKLVQIGSSEWGSIVDITDKWM